MFSDVYVLCFFFICVSKVDGLEYVGLSTWNHTIQFRNIRVSDVLNDFCDSPIVTSSRWFGWNGLAVHNFSGEVRIVFSLLLQYAFWHLWLNIAKKNLLSSPPPFSLVLLLFSCSEKREEEQKIEVAKKKMLWHCVWFVCFFLSRIASSSVSCRSSIIRFCGCSLWRSYLFSVWTSNADSICTFCSSLCFVENPLWCTWNYFWE